MFLASENIDFTGLSHVFLLGGGEKSPFFVACYATINYVYLYNIDQGEKVFV